LTARQTAYIGLGANLGDREAALREAMRRLGVLGTLKAVSSLYETEPIGYRDQPPFLNAVAALETALTPTELVRGLLAIEKAMGRARTFRNAPRTLDLDLLLLGEARLNTVEVGLPHPRLHERAFVLVPLAEIAPDAQHPTVQRSVSQLLDALPTISGVQRFAAPGWELTQREAEGTPPDR